MPLRWNPIDVLTCLEVEPQVEDYEIRYFYDVQKDGLRLTLAVFPLDGDVHIELFMADSDQPTVAVKLLDCDAIRTVKDTRGEYLEMAPGRLFGGRYDGTSPIPYGIRLQARPKLWMEFFHE